MATSLSFVPFGSSASGLVRAGRKLAYHELRVALARIVGEAGLRFDVEPGHDPLPLTQGLTLTPTHGIRVRPRRAGVEE